MEYIKNESLLLSDITFFMNIYNNYSQKFIKNFFVIK